MIPIAKPLATKKQVKMINEVISQLSTLTTGIKACTKEITKGNKGVLILTADTSPMDLITHLPAFCEENKIKYIFYKRKNRFKELHTCVFIPKADIINIYDEI